MLMEQSLGADLIAPPTIPTNLLMPENCSKFTFLSFIITRSIPFG